MCTSYEATNPNDAAEAFSLFPAPNFDYKREIFKDYLAPIFRGRDGSYSTDPATFAMVPRKRIKPGVKPFDTMNARAETVGEKRNFKGPWTNSQLCLIPCNSFYEPNYETGSPVRWRIGANEKKPIAIAGLWRQWDDPEGPVFSFTMLTLNADEHPLMRRFHKPDDEKRSLVILRPSEYEDWLNCKSTDEARSFLRLLPADEMWAEPHPLPPRKPKAIAKEATESRDPKSQDELF